ATGLYTARALSFAGVEYDILRHELTPEQIEVYDTYADAWSILCAARHKTAYREEAVMRRNAA
ncbi:strawberry notch family protein, partial [Pseudoalteromonas sp. NZS100_1]|nr:strawberry notch family protein [Pseudoalteromonas sp. NZS100_1]